MPKSNRIQSVLVIGSGPIVIGQAAEFDYAGTQACLSLKEEGCRVILVNNNPATIMTDEANADAVYFEPLTVESIEKIIAKEKPDGLLATLGGQTGLNLAFALHEQGILEKYNLELLGTPIESIKRGEDREAFRALMHELNEPVPESEIVENMEQALFFSDQVGFPIIVRPAYTLGGSGGGIAETIDEYKSLVRSGLDASPITQCLVEKSIAGFKEVEYEVMRDANDTCITVCNMENIDPVGIHTGDSIVVAPSQTLTDVEYQMLRSSSIKIIRALGIIGGCNIQFALDPNSKQYYLIEVNPRVSRSSALASKATGYPIARIAAKLSLGYTLEEVLNPVTGHTYASFEPALDYVVVKFPCWPFDKFMNADRKLGTQMKATGEVMAIDRNLESALQKAVRSLELEVDGLVMKQTTTASDDTLWGSTLKADDVRFFAILELIRRGVPIAEIANKTLIDEFFLAAFKRLIDIETEVKEMDFQAVTVDQMKTFKKYGFGDATLANMWQVSEKLVREKRKQHQIVPSYKMVDTCAAEFEANTPYFYSTWSGECEVATSNKPKVLIIGSGPIRIGQGIEFDYSSVHSVLALQEEGYETIMINNNPETVSTDYEMADRLYFEPLAIEDVMNVIEKEHVKKVIVQFGGQTAIGLVEGLEQFGIEILGTSEDVIDKLEDRERFYHFLQEVDVPHIPGETAYNATDLSSKAQKIGFPILLRPSYVIGGKGMAVLQSREELVNWLSTQSENVFPILLDAYYPGKEAEVDVLTDGEDILIPTIIEHLEKAGVHSGDSAALLPAQTLTEDEKANIIAYTKRLAQGLDFKGMMNIQFVIYKDNVYVLEVNPRASRTVPILSKVTGVNLVKLGTKLLIRKRLSDITATVGLLQDNPFITVKYPVFSTVKLAGLDPILGPEMKSTGEGIAIAETKEEAFYKAFNWNEQKNIDKKTTIFIDSDEIENGFIQLQNLVSKHGLEVSTDSFENWVKSESALALISLSKEKTETQISKRQEAIKYRLHVFTEWETVEAFLLGKQKHEYGVKTIQDWLTKKTTKEEVMK
ncbi:carbamoyl phosphate synthase large subunit [Bacillus solimangrovi]|uniref:Carbamoyl phosphate synthase large chain n=1 Tax=Bacillus solimangrovi TaxID=1305675 RepID=A0A1E5LC24_9BACI|nr:carbamoyl phosphate synthase large subunit [Bacillus solimangrovi]OEH91640.1 carbamoyl phosphate synthase large subunit [Bacillus solimangrovi]